MGGMERGGGGRGEGVSNIMHGRNHSIIDPRIRTMPGRGTSSRPRPNKRNTGKGDIRMRGRGGVKAEAWRRSRKASDVPHTPSLYARTSNARGECRDLGNVVLDHVVTSVNKYGFSLYIVHAPCGVLSPPCLLTGV